MKGILQATALMTLFLSTVAHAEQWFVPCSLALTTHPFHKLNDFYLSHPEEHQPMLCFRLNDREFLVTQDDSGRVQQGLYYFNAADGTYAFPDGYYRANLTVPLEFNGPNNKHFALLSTSNLHDGTWDESYEVLYLKPKKEARAFELQPLFYVNQDPGLGMCGERMSDGVAANIDTIVIENEGTPQATLVFNITEQTCPNGPQRSAQRRFAWQANHFVEQKR